MESRPMRVGQWGSKGLKGFILFPFYLNFKDSGDTRTFHSLSLPTGGLSLRIAEFSVTMQSQTCFNYYSQHLSITYRSQKFGLTYD